VVKQQQSFTDTFNLELRAKRANKTKKHRKKTSSQGGGTYTYKIDKCLLTLVMTKRSSHPHGYEGVTSKRKSLPRGYEDVMSTY